MPKRKAAGKSAEGPSDAKKQSKMFEFVKTEIPHLSSVVEEKGKGDAEPGELSLSSLITDSEWKQGLESEFKKKYFREIEAFLRKEYGAKKQVFPPQSEIFNAFNTTPLSKVRVVIIGQDPYHDDRQAHGLCFSVQKGVPVPPSLKNIYKELTTDIPGFTAPSHGNLQTWADQGIFLLNATLTVEAHKANSHSKIGWQEFTDAAIKKISENCKGVVFILWGGFAQKKEKLINSKVHTIIKSAHPSPLSVTKFRGCKCFSKTNEALVAAGKEPIDWKLK